MMPVPQVFRCVAGYHDSNADDLHEAGSYTTCLGATGSMLLAEPTATTATLAPIQDLGRVLVEIEVMVAMTGIVIWQGQHWWKLPITSYSKLPPVRK